MADAPGRRPDPPGGRRPRTPMMLLGLLLALATPASAAEEEYPGLAEDDRQTVAPVAAIGRINAAGYSRRRHCTATLITPRHVLTARHCIGGLRPPFTTLQPSSLHFLAGYDRGDWQHHARGRTVTAGEGDQADWAVVELDRALPETPIPLDTAPPVSGQAVRAAGYSADRPHVLTIDPDCRLLGALDDGRWVHDCAATFGDSGGPVLRQTETGWRIIGIHTGATFGPVNRNIMVPADGVAMPE